MSKFESKFERHKRFDSPQQGGGGANSGNRPLNGASKKAFVPAKTVSATSNAATGAVQKSKKPLICYQCQEEGHRANEHCGNCTKFGHKAEKCRSKKVVKAKKCDMSGSSAEELIEFKSYALLIINASSCNSSVLKTNKPMLTKVRLMGIGVTKFECDTAASHSVLSAQVFKLLQERCPKLHSKRQDVTIRLADGSISSKKCGSVDISVETRKKNSEDCYEYASPITL